MKIEFCSGGSRIPGWTHRDMDCDISKPLPYGDGSIEAVRVEHGAEHISFHECMRFFDEVFRILRPGGKFRLCIPVLDRLPNEHARSIIFGHGHQFAASTSLVIHMLRVARFRNIQEVARDEFDHHHTVIGKDMDDLETCRAEGTKPD